jgi:endonuclease/exonuclease/phosphatase family metal-dependent hydrolase
LALVSPDEAVADVLPPDEDRTHTTDRRRLRLLSFNAQVGIHSSRLHHYLTHSWKHFFPFDGRMTNLDRVARFISAFDVVGLQELDAGSMRSNYVDLTAYLSERARFPHAYSRVNRDLGALAKHSLGLLTRLEPARVVMHRLPGPIPGRGAIEARFALANGECLVLFLVHLALGRRARRSQLDYIAAQLAHQPHAVVMGDFNCHPESRELQRLVARTGLLDPMPCAATYPSWDPRRVFDHILLTPDLSVSDMRVYNVNLSDHLPVGIEIELPGERRLIDAAR